jgi:periplasmic protein TonB
MVASNFDRGHLMLPRRMPTSIPIGDDQPSVPSIGSDVGDYMPGVGTGDPNGLRSIISGGNNAPPLPKPAPVTRPIRVSSILEGNLVHRVTPDYPYAAKMSHVQGAVVLAAIISKAGTIEDLRVVSGHPLLVGAAIQAVSQWRYKPYILNNEPVEVETHIVVNFTLGGN